MKKLVFITLLILLGLSQANASAAESFLVNSESTYDIPENGDARVVHNITITNTTTEVYATDYALAIKGGKIADAKAYSEENVFNVEILAGDTTQIRVIFDKPVVGENSSRSFTIEYTDSSLVKRSRGLVEISIPKLVNEDTYSTHIVKLKVPDSFGSPAYISPTPNNELGDQGFKTYYFDKESVLKGVTMAFGEFQVFSFDLTYHLQNPLALPTKMEIAIPPDTSFQRVYYESLSPRPDNIYQDVDGNWLAVYGLGARERLDVRAIGTAQTFASPWKVNSREVVGSQNLAKSKYWQVDDPAILELAEELQTPEKIYNYVVSTLSYNYDKVTLGTTRLGAFEALKNPTDAICTEFTDVFVTLARAAGIPAREINGYAYTDNDALKPLSLVADVLHAWPEYWDEERGVWVPVDPTWGETTGGIDYFSKVDMRHLSFVMHGTDPELPIPPGSYKLGANPQKDVFVSIGELPTNKVVKPEIIISQHTSLPFQGVRLVAEIVNPGMSALYDQKVELFFDDQKKYESSLDILLPYETKTLEFTVPYGFFGDTMPTKALLFVGNSSESFTTNKKPALARDIVSVAVVILVGSIITVLLIKKRR